MNTNILYGIATVRDKQVKLQCGTKFIRFAKNAPYLWTDNKIIKYKEKTFYPLFDSDLRKTQIFISFTEKDIVFETMKIIEIKNCKILNKKHINNINDQKFYFDKYMNPFPYLKQTDEGSEIIGEDEYICFNRINERSSGFPFKEDFNVEIKCESNLSKDEIWSKFLDYSNINYKNSILQISEFFPVFRNFYLNRILYSRFADKYKLEKPKPTPSAFNNFVMNEVNTELEVIDLNELVDIQIIDKNGEINIFNNCKLWDIKRNNILTYEIDDIRNFNFVTYDKIYYLVLPLTVSYEWKQKRLKGHYYSCEEYYKYLILIQVNKQSLETFKRNNIVEKLSGRERINNI
jgi:hypothetical protein